MYAKIAAITISSAIIDIAYRLRIQITVAIGVVMNLQTGELHQGVGFTRFRQNLLGESTTEGTTGITNIVGLLPGNAQVIGEGDVVPGIPGSNDHAEDIVARWAIKNFAGPVITPRGEIVHPYRLLAIGSSKKLCENINQGYTGLPCTTLFDEASDYGYRRLFPKLFANTTIIQ